MKRIIAFALVFVLCVLLVPVRTQAASYPLIFMSTKKSTNTIIEGETGKLIFTIMPEYKNEKYTIYIYNSQGQKVASASNTYYNSSSMPFDLTITVNTATLDLPVGTYKVEYWLSFYSLYEWHDAPNHYTDEFKVIADTCKGNHNFKSTYVWTAPTCEAEGFGEYTCQKCGHIVNKTMPKAHNFGSWSRVDSTTHKHTCSTCSEVETASHTWNSGSVTKQPTCKETGVKTYTCTGCNATKTETIAKSTTHSYGSWTKVNDTTHKHTCSVCQKEETANHTWDSGKVTKAATCKETGVKTYTCTTCKTTKTETIAKLTTHSYGNWTTVDDAIHKHTCSVCQKEETANHTWDSGKVTKIATCKEDGVKSFTCTVCETTKTEPIAKLTTHTYDNACDTECNVCGLSRTVTHDYQTTWSQDRTNHWHECSICKDKKDQAAHTPGEAATETTDQTCTICGYVLAEATGKTTQHSKPTSSLTDSASKVDTESEPASGILVPAIIAIVLLGGGVVGIVIWKKKH